MMNDVRGNITPVETTGKTEKIVAAVIVALGFGAVAAFAYETGSGTSQPKQVAAAHEQIPPSAPQVDVGPSAPSQSTADLQSPADVPAAAPTPKSPTEKDAALTQKAPKIPSEAKPTPAVRVARAPTPNSTVPAPAVQPPVSAEASPEFAARAENIPEQPAPHDSNTSRPVSAPSQEALPQEQPANTAPEQ